jgi:sigma-E factor negative regulatory protein RseA
MHEDLNQKLSQLADDELALEEAFVLLNEMQSSQELKNKFNRYGAISQALKTGSFLIPDPDFSAKISSQIKQEPFYLIPQRKSNLRHGRKLFATAASIAVIGVVAGFGVNRQTENVKMASAFQPSGPASDNPGVSGRNFNSGQVNKQINDYLQAHNSSVYTNGQANFQPYARVTTYSQK